MKRGFKRPAGTPALAAYNPAMDCRATIRCVPPGHTGGKIIIRPGGTNEAGI